MNGITKWLGLTLTVLVAMGSLLVWVGGISADAADTKRRVDTVEKRQHEDRAELKQDQKEIKADVKETKEEVQRIRILLERMGRERSSR